MKKTITLNAQGDKGWIGGLYYVKNIAFQLSLNKSIMDKYNLMVYTSSENYPVFCDLPHNIIVKKVDYKNGIVGKIQKILLYKIYRVSFVFPYARGSKLLGVKSIVWIPDFQHYHYPENFSDEELLRRKKREQGVLESKTPLVLSSKDCKQDYFEKTNTNDDNIYIVPFVSFIIPELKQLSMIKELEILKKYHIENQKYACISNQFWRHKNHIVILQAIKILGSQLDSFRFVFTGLPKDSRDHDYYNSINRLLQDPQVSNHVCVLGFIDRIDQIAIMKNAEFIIQPSLFEGWGTVVEDAKVLDKTILLSDIPVHREQMNEKCILFDPHNPEELAKLIQQECHKEHHDNIEKGIEDMKKRALEYSKGFEQLLRDQEMKS